MNRILQWLLVIFLHLNHPTMIAHDADITVHNIYIYIIYNNIYTCIIYEDDVIYIYNVDGCDILRHQTDG